MRRMAAACSWQAHPPGLRVDRSLCCSGVCKLTHQPPAPPRRLAQHFVNNLWAIASTTPFYSVKIIGRENLPPAGSPAVYVANHQSFMVRGISGPRLHSTQQAALPLVVTVTSRAVYIAAQRSAV